VENFHGRTSVQVNADLKTDWTAADLAVLDVFLLFFGTINQYGDSFPAVWAVDFFFGKTVHRVFPFLD
jgi:hypothetical protein